MRESLKAVGPTWDFKSRVGLRDKINIAMLSRVLDMSKRTQFIVGSLFERPKKTFRPHWASRSVNIGIALANDFVVRVRLLRHHIERVQDSLVKW